MNISHLLKINWELNLLLFSPELEETFVIYLWKYNHLMLKLVLIIELIF